MAETAIPHGPAIIGQDEQTELHVQPMIQGGRRHLDIRVWRRGPTGFSPSRSALTLNQDDLTALVRGISELLEASNDGKQVARVVWDTQEGRRLRAETEPFGTRFQARLGFWQRVRDTWRPVSDGLVLSADRLRPLQKVIQTFQPHLEEPPSDEPEHVSPALQEEALRRWPAPGADWLTAEPHRVTLHPRGLRITGTVEEVDESHVLVLRQWHRQDSLWLPHEEALTLTILELDMLLSYLSDLVESQQEGRHEMAAGEGVTIQIVLEGADEARMLCIDTRQDEDEFRSRLRVPEQEVLRLGRMLGQCGVLLVTSLSRQEREELREHEERPGALEIDEALLFPPEPEVPEEQEADESEPIEEMLAATGAEDVLDTEVAEPDLDEDAATGTEPQPSAVGEVKLGTHRVTLWRYEQPHRTLGLQWEGWALHLPIEHASAIFAGLRGLYYEALRGRRGHVITVGTTPAVHMSVHNRGSETFLALENEMDGNIIRLSFPASEVPVFLERAETAIRTDNLETGEVDDAERHTDRS